MLRGLLSLSPLTVLAVLTSLAQAKLLAILLGPTGTGVVALAISVLALGTALAGLGISSALLKIVAEASDDKARAWQTYTMGLLTVTATGIVLSLIVLLASGLISRTLLNDASLSSGDRRLILVAVALGIVPSAWRTASDGALKGLQTLRRYVIAGAINAVLAPLSIVGFAWALGASGAVVGLVVGQVLAAGVLFAFVASARGRAGDPHVAPRRETVFPAWRRLVALGSLALLAALAGTVGQATLRIVISRTLDLHALGLFAAAWAITNRLPALVYQTLNIYAMPRLSSLGNDWNAITREQNEALRLGVALMAPVLCLAIAASPWLVPILLSHAFLPAARILEIMFVGELLSVVFWTLSTGLFSTGRAAKFAAAEWGFWALLLASSAALAPVFGLRAIAFAYVAAQAAMVTAMYLWERHERGFSWTRANMKLLFVSVAAVVAVAVTHGVATPIRVAFAAGVILVWVFVGLSQGERTAAVRLLTGLPDLLGETMMPRVSVIVTTYNSGRYVGETLASIAAQTFRDFEVIVADDGSSDDTLEIARASNVVTDIVTGPNLGIGGNWARAFSHSSGELVAFVAGDDRWLPEHLETAVAAFERNPAAGISFTDIRLIDEHGRPHVAAPTLRRREPRSGSVSPEEIVRSNFINGQSAVIRRAALTRAGGIDPRIWLAELDLFIRIVDEHPVVYTPVVTAEYRVRFDGLASDYQRGLEWRLQILEKHVRPGRQKRVLVARAYITAAYGQLWPRPSVESVSLARANLAGAFRAWPLVLVLPLYLAMALSTATGPAYVALAPRLHSAIVNHPAKLVVRRLLGMSR